MQEKTQKGNRTQITPDSNRFESDRPGQKLVYHKPTMISYGPLAKNIATGIGGGTEADSTFSI